MAFSYREILEAGFQRIDEEQAAAAAALEAARLSGDGYAVNVAADEILSLDVKRSALSARAQTFVAQQSAPAGNRHGLNADESDIARSMFGSDPNMTDDEREKVYAGEKRKLAHLRRTGQYRDQTG